MTSILLFNVVLSALVFHNVMGTPPAFSKCVESIISKIKEKYWAGGSAYPKDILKTEAANEEDVVLATTKGFFPADTKCTHSKYNDTANEITRYDTSGKFDSVSIALKESEGYLYNEDASQYRYFVLSKNMMSCVYICQNNGPEGTPAAYIESKKGSLDQKTFDELKDALKELGIMIETTFDCKS